MTISGKDISFSDFNKLGYGKYISYVPQKDIMHSPCRVMLILLDEPISGLDAGTVFLLTDLLSQEFSLTSGRVALVVIHQPSYELTKLFHYYYIIIGLEKREVMESEQCRRYGTLHVPCTAPSIKQV